MNKGKSGRQKVHSTLQENSDIEIVSLSDDEDDSANNIVRVLTDDSDSDGYQPPSDDEIEEIIPSVNEVPNSSKQSEVEQYVPSRGTGINAGYNPDRDPRKRKGSVSEIDKESVVSTKKKKRDLAISQLSCFPSSQSEEFSIPSSRSSSISQISCSSSPSISTNSLQVPGTTPINLTVNLYSQSSSSNLNQSIDWKSLMSAVASTVSKNKPVSAPVSVPIQQERDPWDELTDDDIVTLLKMFGTLDDWLKEELLEYVKKLEKTNPTRLKILKIKSKVKKEKDNRR